MTQLAISDRALVRWIERTGLVDLEAVRAALRDSLERAATAAGNLKAGEYLILADGLVYVVRDQVLITVIEEDNRHGHVRALRRRAESNRDA